jgi:hypothetical protein
MLLGLPPTESDQTQELKQSTDSVAESTSLLGIFISTYCSLYVHVTMLFMHQLLSVFCIVYFIFLLQ